MLSKTQRVATIKTTFTLSSFFFSAFNCNYHLPINIQVFHMTFDDRDAVATRFVNEEGGSASVSDRVVVRKTVLHLDVTEHRHLDLNTLHASHFRAQFIDKRISTVFDPPEIVATRTLALILTVAKFWAVMFWCHGSGQSFQYAVYDANSDYFNAINDVSLIKVI